MTESDGECDGEWGDGEGHKHCNSDGAKVKVDSTEILEVSYIRSTPYFDTLCLVVDNPDGNLLLSRVQKSSSALAARLTGRRGRT